jgi:hypothetical protein
MARWARRSLLLTRHHHRAGQNYVAFPSLAISNTFLKIAINISSQQIKETQSSGFP